MAPIISGNMPKNRFCITSISPKAVPSCLGLTNIGKVGIIIEQNMAIDIPMMETGTHRTHSYALRSDLVSI
jgi:hypothetical protein